MRRRTFIRVTSNVSLTFLFGGARAAQLRTPPGIALPPVRIAPLAAFGKVGAAVSFRLAESPEAPSGVAVRVNAPVAGVTVTAWQGGERVHVRAYELTCTHAGCAVQEPETGVVSPDTTLRCPCHGSRFEATTGRRVAGPAFAPLSALALTVRQGEVWCVGTFAGS